MIPYEKFNKSDTSFEDNTSQNNHLSSHITYCVKHYILCLAQYCIQQNSVFTLTRKFICSPFTCQRAAVLSCCACEAPQLDYRSMWNKGLFCIPPLKDWWFNRKSIGFKKKAEKFYYFQTKMIAFLQISITEAWRIGKI